MARSAASVIAEGSTGAESLRANRDALSIFIAKRRPTFIWDSSKGESVPGRAMAARQRTASAPNLSRIWVGTITLPLDFDIFLRSGSTTKPEIVARCQGSCCSSRCERTTRENNQVRMMSWAWGAMSMGKVSCHNCLSRSHPQAICGDREEVAHVSITSGSAMNPPGIPRICSVYPGAG